MCGNILGHLLMDTITYSLVCFIIITDNISSNPTPHMVIPFLFFPMHLQEKCQEKERKRRQIENNKFQAQRKP